MFETAEIGQELSKQAYQRHEHRLRAELLVAQQALRQAPFAVIVIVSGVELAGKGEVVNRLNEWLDARGVSTVAFWDETDEERERPREWRFWRALPGRGSVGILFGSWYTDPIVQRALGKMGRRAYEAQLERIVELERTLTDDGTVLVKLWFHISRKEQQRRLADAQRRNRRKLTRYEKSFSRQYDRFADASDTAVRMTDLGNAPWHVIDSKNRRYRDLTAGQILLEAMNAALARKPPAPERPARLPRQRRRLILDTVDLAARTRKAEYEKAFADGQAELNALTWKLHRRGISTVALFEGWDAAGKGGAIRRIVAAIDARLVRVMPVAAPTDEERAHHYLWRFWRHVPRAGYVTVFDRSWYGRVLVERVEGFARAEEWQRAYGEINAFEDRLSDHGIVLCKFWLHISAEEQLRRFREREKTVYKRYKITPDDWRNRKRWHAYELAVDEMVARTSTAQAPWTLVAADDKRSARLTVLRTLCERSQAALDR